MERSNATFEQQEAGEEGCDLEGQDPRRQEENHQDRANQRSLARLNEAYERSRNP